MSFDGGGLSAMYSLYNLTKAGSSLSIIEGCIGLRAAGSPGRDMFMIDFPLDSHPLLKHVEDKMRVVLARKSMFFHQAVIASSARHSQYSRCDKKCAAS